VLPGFSVASATEVAHACALADEAALAVIVAINLLRMASSASGEERLAESAQRLSDLHFRLRIEIEQIRRDSAGAVVCRS
jgi:hypothetical protein